MPVLSTEQRNQLARVITAARETAEAGARSALQALAVHHHDPYSPMTPEQRARRVRLRAHGRQTGDSRDPQQGTQAIENLTRECAYEHWHRMLFARYLSENNLLVEPVSGVAISMAECEELARKQNKDPWVTASLFAQRMLPRIFRVDDPVLAVTLPPETQQTLERMLAGLPAAIFTADDSLGWTYQFWQTAEKVRVNDRADSGEKITGNMLPAVTQLFTEHYMVLFLLHNSIGAWHAGKALAGRRGLAQSAADERQLRDAIALDGYAFDYLRFIREPNDGEQGSWRPASGTYDAWPKDAKALKVLDPCCGSGHFLTAAFDLLVRLRRAEGDLSLDDAIRAVLADNLYGLEIDARCTQIAAFNLALAAWKMAGRVLELPELNIACSGLSTGVPKAEWLRLANGNEHLWGGMEQLYKLFEQASELGSLIDPLRALGDGNMITADFHEVQPLLEQALGHRDTAQSEERREIGVTAQGIARASELLAGKYHLVLTNVPYLKRGKQGEILRVFCEQHFPEAKNDLATVFLERCLDYCYEGGATSIVLPQNWLFLSSYKKLREKLLKNDIWHMVSLLGPGAFETISGEVVKAILIHISRGQTGKETIRSRNLLMGIDASELHQPAQKAEALRVGDIKQVGQTTQLDNPDARVILQMGNNGSLLSTIAYSYHGLTSGDMPRMRLAFWEISRRGSIWIPYQGTVNRSLLFGGNEYYLHWCNGSGAINELEGARKDGKEAWGKTGVLVSQMLELQTTTYTLHAFDNNTAVIIPFNEIHLPAIWCFCSSPEYNQAVRRIDKALKVTNATLVQVPFDQKRWQAVAEQKYPNGLPAPYSDDPTQWIFHGHPCGSVIWDEETKRTAHGSLRADAGVLQVAVARLLGYRWPAELDADMELCDEARVWVKKCGDLLPFADPDGIVCLSPIRGEAPAADRLRRMLAAAYGKEWSAAKERQIMQAAGVGKSNAWTLEEWLQERFFEEHCKLFGHRPFIWHVWDGCRDGFNALINYHRLAGPDGEGRRTLEAIANTYLGDWIERQRAEHREGKEGSDARLVAALGLQEQLILILEGEPPYDIFVRWKPLCRQPVGWQPDINDGVRMNIRPFLSAQLPLGGRSGAGVLRWKPKIGWNKDRGAEPQNLRPKGDYPWFWGCEPERNNEHRTDFIGGQRFDGNRWNELHFTNEKKREAREAKR